MSDGNDALPTFNGVPSCNSITFALAASERCTHREHLGLFECAAGHADVSQRICVEVSEHPGHCSHALCVCGSAGAAPRGFGKVIRKSHTALP